jgi:hypothetical protein
VLFNWESKAHPFLKRERRAFLRGYPLKYLRFAVLVKALLANRAQQVLLHVSSVPAGVGSRSKLHVSASRIECRRHEVALEKRFDLKAKTALSKLGHGVAKCKLI